MVAGLESWEKEDSRINADGYKWFGKPCSSQTSQRGEGGVGFLVRECLVSEVEFISQVNYDDSLWLKLRGERGRGALFVGCVIVLVLVFWKCYKRMCLSLGRKGIKVVLLGDFNARVGKADDVIGMFGEDTCNSSGNRLISFLHEVDLVVCNGRRLVLDPAQTNLQ